MITTPSAGPLERLRELTQYLLHLEVGCDVVLLTRREVAEMREVCEGVQVPPAPEGDPLCAECGIREASVCAPCYAELAEQLDDVRRAIGD